MTLPTIQTVEERAYILKMLVQIKSALYSADATIQRDALSMLPPLWNTFLTAGINQKSRLEQDEFITSVETSVEHLPVFTLHLSFIPSSRFMESVSAWIHAQTRTPVLIDTRIDPMIIMGARIEWNGRLKDYSISRKHI